MSIFSSFYHPAKTAAGKTGNTCFWKHTNSRERGAKTGTHTHTRAQTKNGREREEERAAASLRLKANSLQSGAPLGSLPHTSSGPCCTAPVNSAER
ncbi:MAG: hypothetical protein ATN36_00695 [Epulopiscium sp. Nele67-Bin005]|nr:MAG: hypothetical protein ATN36_00695 [Epulopiscium sp. Nele67-Bin005]